MKNKFKVYLKTALLFCVVSNLAQATDSVEAIKNAKVGQTFSIKENVIFNDNVKYSEENKVDLYYPESDVVASCYFIRDEDELTQNQRSCPGYKKQVVKSNKPRLIKSFKFEEFKIKYVNEVSSSIEVNEFTLLDNFNFETFEDVKGCRYTLKFSCHIRYLQNQSRDHTLTKYNIDSSKDIFYESLYFLKNNQKNIESKTLEKAAELISVQNDDSPASEWP